MLRQNMKFNFSIHRLMAVMLKEFTQMKRDRLTFAMIIGIPLIQLILFGYAINTDPKHLPTVVVSADDSEFTRKIISSMQTSDYFKILEGSRSTEEATWLLRTGDAQFALYIPQDFTERLLHGDQPEILLEADATDPSATGNAI